MSDEFDHEAEAFEQLGTGYDDEAEAEFWLNHDYRITCRYCQRPRLRWEQEHGRWYLVERDGTTHVCAPQPATPGEPQP